MTEVLGNNYMDLRHWSRGRRDGKGHICFLLSALLQKFNYIKKNLKQGNFILNDYC